MAEVGNLSPSQAPLGDTLIYEYGIRLDKHCLEAVGDQIIKARQLYNNLVASIRAIVSDMQSFVLDKAGADANRVQAEIERLNEQFADAKSAVDEDSMKIIAQERRLKWHELGNMLKSARAEHKAAIQQRYLSRIGKNSSCDTYKIRSQAVAQGLGWATANAVLDAALVAWKKSFMLGRPPRFAVGAEKDQDTLTLQFTAKGGVEIQRFLDGSHGELTLKPTQGCGRRKYGEFAFRLGPAAAETYATGTWQYHRPLPPKATVGLARLVRRRIGKDYRWAVQLMVKLPATQEKQALDRKPLVSVHFGWAADLGGRRVAGIADSADPESSRLLQLPTGIEENLSRAAAIQSERDQARDTLVPKVKELEFGDSAPEIILEELKALRRLPAQHVALARLHRLCRMLREHAVLPDWMEIWRKEDRMRWQSASHLARRARYARRDFYRNTALELAKRYSAIAIEPLDLKTAAKKVDEVTGEKSEFNRKARAGRVVAALYELESAIRWAAAKEGTALIEVAGATVSTCGICGGKTEDLPEEGQIVRCRNCGAEIDRKKAGAATAWCRVFEHREGLITQYWIDRQATREKVRTEKEERRAKMADGRRKARTTIENQATKGSRAKGISDLDASV